MKFAALVMPLVLLLQGGTPPQSSSPFGLEFVAIKPGSFQMGCSPDDDDCSDGEKPAHTVTLTRAFELAKYEVTQAQWQAVMGNNSSRFKGDTRPADQVSWNEAQQFLRKLNARNDGYRYRLPTEAEWEYAARAGTTGARPGELDAIAWYVKNSGSETHPVGQKQPNAWGLYDMLGNVAEWVQDWRHSYTKAPQTDPAGPSAAPITNDGAGNAKIFRGACWGHPGMSVRVSDRDIASPDMRNYSNGFRVARETAPAASQPAAQRGF